MSRILSAVSLVVALALAGPAAASGTLRIALQEDPDALDPAQGVSFVGRVVFAGLCDKLIDIDQNLAYVPQLATEWAWSADNLALTMRLRPGVVFHDDMRTVDYLVTRPEVDRKRIGCLGISMGGYRSIYLSALDERIAAACVVGFMSTVKPMIKAHIDTHSWVHFLPGLHRWLDLPDVATLAAPRALLVQQCAQDRLFPPAGMKEAVDKIAAVYKKAGAEKKFAGRFYDVPHQFTRRMQDDAFAWLDKHLGHKSRG